MSKKQKKKRKQNKKELNENEDENEEITNSKEEEIINGDELSKKESNEDSEIKASDDSAKKAAEPMEKISKCSVCDEEFETRNKLFEHIKKEGHAALKPAQPDQPLSHNQMKKNKRLAKASKK